MVTIKWKSKSEICLVEVLYQKYWFLNSNLISKNMPQKRIEYESKIDQLPFNKIYINVNKMEKGDYELNIINQNKVVKKTTFKKV